MNELFNFLGGGWRSMLGAEHDCKLVGGHGEESCDHPEHSNYPEISGHVEDNYEPFPVDHATYGDWKFGTNMGDWDE